MWTGALLIGYSDSFPADLLVLSSEFGDVYRLFVISGMHH